MTRSDRKLIEGVDEIRLFLATVGLVEHQPAMNTVCSILLDVQDVMASSPKSLTLMAWKPRYLTIAKAAIGLLGRKFVPDEFCSLLMRKQEMYGSKAIESWGNLGVMIRIDSKVQRYLHLSENQDVDIHDEPLHDTLMDIVGYCLLGYMFCDKNRLT